VILVLTQGDKWVSGDGAGSATALPSSRPSHESDRYYPSTATEVAHFFIGNGQPNHSSALETATHPRIIATIHHHGGWLQQFRGARSLLADVPQRVLSAYYHAVCDTPRPVDDIVAILLIERYLERLVT